MQTLSRGIALFENYRIDARGCGTVGRPRDKLDSLRRCFAADLPLAAVVVRNARERLPSVSVVDEQVEVTHQRIGQMLKLFVQGTVRAHRVGLKVARHIREAVAVDIRIEGEAYLGQLSVYTAEDDLSR